MYHTSKQVARQEKKVKKMAAYMEISKLNDRDREAKLQCGTLDSAKSDFSSTEQPCSKKMRMDNEEYGNEDQSKSELALNVNEKNEDVDSSAKKLTPEQYAELKQHLRNRKKMLKNIPWFRLKSVGESASLSSLSDKRIPLFITDIQHLLLYSILGNQSPYLPSRWCTLEKHTKISHVVVIVVEGMSIYHLSSYESLFKNVNNIFKNRVEVVTPAVYNGSIVNELASVPLTGSQKELLIAEYGSLEAALEIHKDLMVMIKAVFPIEEQVMRNAKIDSCDKTDKQFLPETDVFSRTKLLLSAWQMVEHNYPLPLKGELSEKYSNYVLTKDSYLEVTHNSPMFGLDCEMCFTTLGHELTRISIVNEKEETIYDRLVKPQNPIIDYVTMYSGITEQMLKNVETRLADVQRDIRELLPGDAILVGQSLDKDLNTLEMMHPYCIDTSVIFNITGERYKKTKLKTLAREFLGSKIQEGNSGHDSVEDGVASLQLTKLKLANGVDFGDAVLSGLKTSELVYKAKNEKEYSTSIFKHVSYGPTQNVGIKDRSSLIIGCEEVMDEYQKTIKLKDTKLSNNKVNCITESNNKNVIKKTCYKCMENGFTMAHIKIPKEKVEHPNAEKTIKNLDKNINSVWSHMAVNSLCVVVFGGQSNSNGSCFVEVKKNPIQL